MLSIVLYGCRKKDKVDSFRASMSKESSNKIILGFSQIGAESAWRNYNTVSIQRAAAKAGIQLLYVNGEQKQENQIQAIRSFIAYQVDVIAFVPIVQTGWENVLGEARAAGIPVIVCDRKISVDDETLYEGYIGTDSVEEGRQAAHFLERKYEGQEGVFNILELRGTDDSSASDGRVSGFHSVLDSDPRFNVILSISGDFMRSRGEEIARNLLRENNGLLEINGQKIDILFSCNDGMTLGFLSVLEENNIMTGKNITVITVDAQQEAVDMLRDGKINCVIECNPDQGDGIMELVKKLAGGYDIPRHTNVEERIFSEFDDLSSIEPRGY